MRSLSEFYTHPSVSIPFSSGQRMRLEELVGKAVRFTEFQSPFHRVKGCDIITACDEDEEAEFQSPFHRVKGCD